MINLRGGFCALQPQKFPYKIVGKSPPVVVWIRRIMGVKIAGSATKLGAVGEGFQQGNLPVQALHKYPKFFAQQGGRRRLAVGAGQHGHVCPIQSQLKQLLAKGQDGRKIHPLQRVLEQQRRGRIVHILRSESKMHKLAQAAKPQSVKPFLQKIFYGLHIMVGGALYGFDIFGVGFRKIFKNGV